MQVETESVIKANCRGGERRDRGCCKRRKLCIENPGYRKEGNYRSWKHGTQNVDIKELKKDREGTGNGNK